IMDWHHPDYLPRRDWEAATRPVDGADFSRFVTYLHVSVDEILSNYGDIDVLWFDGNWEKTWTHPLAKALYDEIRARHPGVIINNRINGAGTPAGQELGDYGTPEQQIPATGMPGKDWESCMTMNDNWGYQAADHNWKSPRTLADLLVETASKGGNLLMNVGPMADGRFPPEAVARLEILGDWMSDHGDAIYGTTASLFADTLRFRSTTQGKRLHLFVSDWTPGPLPLPGLQTRPTRAWARLGAGTRLAIAITGTEGAGTFALTLPGSAPATLLPVITVEFAEAPRVA
ncbi:MAG: alpha-L-fucosidase, partial [Gemmatimonadales bacterium]